jgi:hypothetical protein
MKEYLLNIPLLRCAIEKISSAVWDGVHQKMGDIYAVKRGTSSPKSGEGELELYCISSEPDPTAITALLGTGAFEKVREVVLIGEHTGLAIHALEKIGFKQNWETIVYFKALDTLSMRREPEFILPEDVKFSDITIGSLPLANSFCDEFKITRSSLLDPSFISRFLTADNSCVGKIQLILCPPHGAFCVFAAIKESARGRGYFKLMMSAAEAWARDRALPQMALYSSACANKIGLYPKLGYVVGGTYKIFGRGCISS